MFLFAVYNPYYLLYTPCQMGADRPQVARRRGINPSRKPKSKTQVLVRGCIINQYCLCSLFTTRTIYYTPIARWSQSAACDPSEQTKTQFWNPVLEPKSRAQIPWVGYNEPTYLFLFAIYYRYHLLYTPCQMEPIDRRRPIGANQNPILDPSSGTQIWSPNPVGGGV